MICSLGLQCCCCCVSVSGCSTHSLHQDELFAANQAAVDGGCLLSEHGDELLQPPLLHLCGHVVREPVVRVGLLHEPETVNQ